MTNFYFLQNEWNEIYEECFVAEENVFKIPIYSAITSRSALEKMIHWLYENDASLQTPYDTSLATLMHTYEFKSLIGERIFRELNIVRKTGNTAAHGKKVSAHESLLSLKYLHAFAAFLAKFYSREIPVISPFKEEILKTGEEEKLLKRQLEIALEKVKKQEEAFNETQAALKRQLQISDEITKKLHDQQEVFASRRAERQQSQEIVQSIPINVSEKETREMYINLFLKEAGWDTLRNGREIEFELVGMPKSTNPSGKGYADYVLWGKDGLPLAVIEAKKTKIGVEKGRQQALLYADALEQKFKQRPIIYYTNGFETTMWEDTFSTPREVQGFYAQDELQLLIDRRKTRVDLRTFKPNSEIAGRSYQLEAVKRVAEHFSTVKNNAVIGLNRRSLLVMATGSGKTRTAASIIDMLTKCNWAKRVLFLADRNALVTQAKNSISSLLPNLTSIDLTKEREDNGTRLVFSTYPTIMNKIDSVRSEEERFYSIGHFDVIFIDEAHRSVYQKYKAIFDYFDALVVGLTATPKKDVDINTYELFEIENDNPTFSYELETAIHAGYLVPPKAVKLDLKFMRDGIKYNELSEKEKQEFEVKFGDPTQTDASDEIGNAALNSWLFNDDTVDKALDLLMTKGIKVEGGNKLGKTIIFAKNHDHALFIEKRFNKNYPEYQGHFLRVIDNYESKAQDLLERFVATKTEEDPQIAVSVDMMDTGVDAPRVVNLVFFKPVKSASKFWQMIGRGTRLCPNLFGPGDDKTHFLIFDLCKNFEFFDEFPDGESGTVQKSLFQRLFELRLDIACSIEDAVSKSEEDIALQNYYLAVLHDSIQSLDTRRFQVQKKLRSVVTYSDFSKWQSLSKSGVLEVKQELAGLPISLDSDESALRFDYLILKIQFEKLNQLDETRSINNVISIAKDLSKKTNIPAIFNKLAILKIIQTENYWTNCSLTKLEDLRVSLRELMVFLDRVEKANVYTSFTDEVISLSEKDVIPVYQTQQNYKDRVEQYIREHADHLVISKLKNNIPITPSEIEVLESILFSSDEIGTSDDFKKNYGEQPLGAFIRSIVGLDMQAAQHAFSTFLQAGNLQANQITFVQNIIQYLSKNGVIDKALFFEPPFTELHQDGIIGIFDDAEATSIFSIVDQINQNALA